MKKLGIWLGLVVVMVVTLITYSGHFHNSFHYDDIHTIVNNGYIRDLHSIPRFFTDATTFSSLPANQSYRPLLSTTLAIDYSIGNGLTDTFQFHITSFLSFILLGILMFILFRRILYSVSEDPRIDMAALFAVAWFMLHPVCAETVNYIIQRGDLLSTLFVVCGLSVYATSPFCRRYFIYLIPVILGILTKPTALMFAPILVCYVVLFEDESGFISFFRNRNKPVKGILITTAVAFIFCITGYVLVTGMMPSTNPDAGIASAGYRITQPFVLLYYVGAWFAPVHLAIDTDMTVFSSPFEPLALVGYAFLIVLMLLIIWTSEKKSTRPIAFGLTWFLLANVPTSLSALAEVENDHRMFFPFVGLSLAVVWTVHLSLTYLAQKINHEKSTRIAVGIAMILILGICAYGTFERNRVWLSEETLWLDCTIKSPNNGRAMLNYGLALLDKGDPQHAEEYFTKALVLMPTSANAYLDMGIVKHVLHKDDEVEKNLVQAMNYGSRSCPTCYYYYALFLNEKGRRDEAIKVLYAGYQMSDANIDSRDLLMELLYKEQRLEELHKLVNASGPPPVQTAEDHINLSGQAYRIGDYQKCINEANKALELKPDFAAAYNNIGAAANKLKRYKEAKEASLKAIQLDSSSRFAKVNLDAAERGLKDGTK
jgi:tetratricopeptide (TPR) repeat protein